MSEHEQLIHGLVESTTHVLRTMANRDVSYTGLIAAPSFILLNQVCGVVSIRGAIKGIVAMSCGTKLAQHLVSSIVGGAAEAITEEDLLDGMAELVNMICGGMKSRMGKSSDVELLSPMAIMGVAYTAQWKTQHDTSVLQFHVEGEMFQVHASF